jgi:RNA polymerase sigma factor (sigma-70 family)
VKHNLEFKNCTPDRRVRELLEESIARLDEVLNFRSSAVFFRVFVEKNAARTLYRASLTLKVPGRTLAAQEERHDLLGAVREALMELERELRKHKERLTHSDAYKRLARRQQLRRQKTEPVPNPQRRRELFFSLIERHLEGLYSFTHREINYRIALGDVLPGEISADDALAAVVLRGAREFEKDFEQRNIPGWLIRLALEHVDAEVKKVQQARETSLHAEEDVPETSPTEAVSTLGDEILDFYQPDEDLKLEDILPGPSVPTPEQILESRELQRYILGSLAKLPRALRLAFVLRYAEGLPIAEVVQVTGQSQSEVERNIERARGILLKRLVNAGLAPDQKAAETVFGTASNVKVTTQLRRSLEKAVRTDAGGAHLAQAADVTP